MGKIISFINYKGGVGKTTLAVEMASSLAYHYGKKVLLVDVDPQTNATFYLVDENIYNEQIKANDKTIKKLFEQALAAISANEIEEFSIDDLIIDHDLPIHEYTEKLHLIPSDIELHDIDLRLAVEIGMDALLILRENLRELKTRYDYIFIDCPPNLYLVTRNAMVASDGILIVATPEYLAVRGIALIKRVLDDSINIVNKTLKRFGVRLKIPEIVGIIFNRVRIASTGDILIDQKRNIETVRESELGNKVFENYITETVKFPERSAMKLPVSIASTSQYTRYVEQIKSVTEEFIERVEENE